MSSTHARRNAVLLAISVSVTSIVLGIFVEVVTGALPADWQRWVQSNIMLLTIAMVTLGVLATLFAVAQVRSAWNGPDEARSRHFVLKWFREVRVRDQLDNPKLLYANNRMDLPIEYWSHNPQLRASARLQMLDLPDYITLAKLPEVISSVRHALILGGMGAGKTTILLEFGRHLLERSERDENEPVPFLFDLSVWSPKLPSFRDWLAFEMVREVGSLSLPREAALALLESGRIAPLLDGLDELSELMRGPCALAINRFLHDERRIPVIVACREAEYNQIASAVESQQLFRVHSLGREDVRAFIENAGEEFDGLRSAILSEPGVLELLKSPLMVMLAQTAYSDFDYARGDTLAGVGSAESRLIRRYLDVKLSDAETREVRAGDDWKGDTAPRVARVGWEFELYLGWLARSLLRTNQNVITRRSVLQRAWLSRNDRFYVDLWTGVFSGAVFGMFGAAAIGYPLSLWLGWPGTLLGGLLGCALTVAIGAISSTLLLHHHSEDTRMVMEYMSKGGIVQTGSSFYSIAGWSSYFAVLIVGSGVFCAWYHAPVAALIGTLVGAPLGAIAMVGMQHKAADRPVPVEQMSSLLADIGGGSDTPSLKKMPIWSYPFLLLGGVLAIWLGLLRLVLIPFYDGILRLILWSIAVSLPPDFETFLQQCAKLSLLRQTGGRYFFLHRSLMDYLAEHYDEVRAQHLSEDFQKYYESQPGTSASGASAEPDSRWRT